MPVVRTQKTGEKNQGKEAAKSMEKPSGLSKSIAPPLNPKSAECQKLAFELIAAANELTDLVRLGSRTIKLEERKERILEDIGVRINDLPKGLDEKVKNKIQDLLTEVVKMTEAKNLDAYPTWNAASLGVTGIALEYYAKCTCKTQ